MVQTRTQNYAPKRSDFTKSKEPRHVVLDSVETVDVPATKILSPDDLSTEGFDFGNIKLPQYSTQFIQREKGKRDVALALAPNPPELKEHRQADQDITPRWMVAWYFAIPMIKNGTHFIFPLSPKSGTLVVPCDNSRSCSVTPADIHIQ